MTTYNIKSGDVLVIATGLVLMAKQGQAQPEPKPVYPTEFNPPAGSVNQFKNANFSAGLSSWSFTGKTPTVQNNSVILNGENIADNAHIWQGLDRKAKAGDTLLFRGKVKPGGKLNAWYHEGAGLGIDLRAVPDIEANNWTQYAEFQGGAFTTEEEILYAIKITLPAIVPSKANNATAWNKKHFYDNKIPTKAEYFLGGTNDRTQGVAWTGKPLPLTHVTPWAHIWKDTTPTAQFHDLEFFIW